MSPVPHGGANVAASDPSPDPGTRLGSVPGPRTLQNTPCRPRQLPHPSPCFPETSLTSSRSMSCLLAASPPPYRGDGASGTSRATTDGNSGTQTAAQTPAGPAVCTAAPPPCPPEMPPDRCLLSTAPPCVSPQTLCTAACVTSAPTRLPQSYRSPSVHSHPETSVRPHDLCCQAVVRRLCHPADTRRPSSSPSRPQSPRTSPWSASDLCP